MALPTATAKGTTRFDNVQIDGALSVASEVNLEAAGGAPLVSQRITMNVTNGGVAGTHTGSVTLPAGAVLHNVIVHNVTVWNAGTSALLDVGDATDPNGYLAAVNVKTLTATHDVDLYFTGTYDGADITVGTYPDSFHERRYLAAARVVTALLTLVGTTASTGETVVEVIYSLPSATYTTEATYAAT